MAAVSKAAWTSSTENKQQNQLLLAFLPNMLLTIF